jgi:hypothetical protein
MLHPLRFSLQNAVYFIMLPFLVHVLFKFYIQGVLKFKCKTRVPKDTCIHRHFDFFTVGTLSGHNKIDRPHRAEQLKRRIIQT